MINQYRWLYGAWLMDGLDGTKYSMQIIRMQRKMEMSDIMLKGTTRQRSKPLHRLYWSMEVHGLGGYVRYALLLWHVLAYGFTACNFLGEQATCT